MKFEIVFGVIVQSIFFGFNSHYNLNGCVLMEYSFYYRGHNSLMANDRKNLYDFGKINIYSNSWIKQIDFDSLVYNVYIKFFLLYNKTSLYHMCMQGVPKKRKSGMSYFVRQVSNDFQQIKFLPIENLVRCGYVEYNRFSDVQIKTEIWLARLIDLLWRWYVLILLIIKTENVKEIIIMHTLMHVYICSKFDIISYASHSWERK